jgi:hypothetical protein
MCEWVSEWVSGWVGRVGRLKHRDALGSENARCRSASTCARACVYAQHCVDLLPLLLHAHERAGKLHARSMRAWGMKRIYLALRHHHVQCLVEVLDLLLQ